MLYWTLDYGNCSALSLSWGRKYFRRFGWVKFKSELTFFKTEERCYLSNVYEEPYLSKKLNRKFSSSRYYLQKTIEKIKEKAYRGRQYPRFWLTENGILLAMSERIKPEILLRKTQEIYPKNRKLQFIIEAIPFLPRVSFQPSGTVRNWSPDRRWWRRDALY